MKIVLASPKFPQPRGNTVTVQRIADNLEKLGVQTEIVSTTEESSLHSFPQADLVHGFHAYQFYQFLQKLGRPLHPYVVTLTGTDLNHDLFHPDRRADVLASLKGAAAIHVFDEKAKQILIRETLESDRKIFVVRQGNSEFPSDASPFEKEQGTFLFVLPAGIRKVKNIPDLIGMLRKLHGKRPDLRLWLVGPVLEEAEGKTVLDLAEEHSDWVTYLGQVPHAEMGSIYRQADVVLNNSFSEGQPAAILEAMGYGLPVLVSDIPGNSGIVSHDETGFLYKNDNEFLDYAERLVNNNAVKQKIGQQAKQHIAEHHSSSKEAKALLDIYNSILKGKEAVN